jgi:cation:H+ antiporter
MSDWLLIAAGLTTLVVAAELLVRGSVWIALQLGVTPLVVGLTLVAFGTSAPELVVSLDAALQGNSGIATGNVFGSNVANIGLILGLAAAISPIAQHGSTVRFELVFLLAITLLTPGLALIGNQLYQWEGALLFLLLVWFTVQLIRRGRTDPEGAQDLPLEVTAERRSRLGTAMHLLFIGAGLAGLFYGAGWLVDGATGIARAYGISDIVIGLTIVAVGTSLPELATSAVAAVRGESGIAVGNVIGSNVFNLCSVLGVTAIVRPLPVDWRDNGPSIAAGLLLTLLLAFTLLRRHGVSRPFGILLLGLYAAFVAITLAPAAQ